MSEQNASNELSAQLEEQIRDAKIYLDGMRRMDDPLRIQLAEVALNDLLDHYCHCCHT